MPTEVSCSALDEVLDGSNLYFLRSMGNSYAQPTLALDSQNRMWIIKAWNSHSYDNALANEMLGSHLCRAVGLASPECKKILIEDRYFDYRGTWLVTDSGLKKPEAGVHLASRFYPDIENTEVMEFMPPTLRSRFVDRQNCLGMALFDAWANHADRRQSLFYRQGDNMCASFIDHSHIFGGPLWKRGGRCHTPANFVQRVATEEYKEPEVSGWIKRMQDILPAAFAEVIPQIPSHWYHGDIFTLKQFYLKRLHRLHLLMAEIVLLVQNRAYGTIETERSFSDFPIRLLSERGTDLWF